MWENLGTSSLGDSISVALRNCSKVVVGDEESVYTRVCNIAGRQSEHQRLSKKNLISH